MSDPFIGEIRLFGGKFAPNGFAFCDGKVLPIAQNVGLWSVLSSNYGSGTPSGTFALPNLCGRMPVGSDVGTGNNNYPPGSSGGVEQVTLSAGNIPAHNHLVNAYNGAATGASPSTVSAAGVRTPYPLLANSTNTDHGPVNIYGTGLEDPSVLNEDALQPAGSDLPVPAAFSVRNPYLAINFIICTSGQVLARAN
ncbi:tail fiber protein [Pseudomonas sp. 148P]|uniref:Tail fiber protein n=1 Tax=Pseudomonas ulcerans TaxID=3115852 RepID=A0ABU7HTI5_9PSED|nr:MULTISPECIES: tail fiber protein [unclassified Pseudomonas]MEE1923273.1 tail fiber protein [Pseudomonas sp. 147P]MEE1934852.1 tail fiber protein [Pseudomonas sp. 148P]